MLPMHLQRAKLRLMSKFDGLSSRVVTAFWLFGQ